MDTYASYLFNKHAPGAGEAMTKTLSLYAFLIKHLDTPVETLQQHIIINGTPMFTVKELEEVLTKVRTQLDTPYAKRILSQSGGAVPTLPSMPTPGTMPGLPASSSSTPAVPTTMPGHGLDKDPSRSKFWDKMIRKLFFPITKYIPSCMEPLLYWYFILYNLEQMEGVGPFISTALDTVTLSLPVLADMSAETLATLVAAAPVPYASFVGDGLGFGISLMFILVGITMNNSRKHFGSAFKLSLEALPIIGEAASDGSQQFEIGAERYLQNRKRILDSIKPTMPKTGAILEYYTPTPDIVEGPAPTIDIATLKDEVGDKVEAVTGVDIETAISDPVGAVKQVAEPIIAPIEAATGVDVDKLLENPGAALSAAVPALPAMPTLPTAALPAAPEVPAVPAAPALPAVPAAPALPAVPAAPALPAVPAAPTAPAIPTLPTAPSVSTNTSSASSSISKPNGAMSFAPTPIRKRGGTRRPKRNSKRITRKK